MEGNLNLILDFGVPFLLLFVAYLTGTTLERRHYRSIRRREDNVRGFPAITFKEAPEAWNVRTGALVTGSVVISIDYFKRFLGGLRAIFGGRIKSYEPLLDRARREALLRMKETAIEGGFDAVLNVRFETSRLANSTGQGQGTAGVEILVFGTAVKLSR